MDEQALIQAACRGELSAFNKLILAYQSLAFNLAYRILGNGDAAEDATQDAFIKAYRNLNQYRGGSFKAWLLRIVTNVCYDQLRHIQRRPTSSLDDMAMDPEHAGRLLDHAEQPGAYALRQERGAMIQQGIALLPPDQRTVLVLFAIVCLIYGANEQGVDTAVATVTSRLSPPPHKPPSSARSTWRAPFQCRRRIFSAKHPRSGS